MRPRNHFLLGATVAVLAVAVLAAQRKQPQLSILERASRAAAETPPKAILIEMGIKDVQARDWSGHANVAGAKVVHREGYRFRTEDRLTDGAGWKASSHRGMRVPPKQPQVSKMEPIATVGIVLHLAEVTPDATLTVALAEGQQKASIALTEVLAGQTLPLWNGTAEVRLISTANPIVTGPTEDDYPAAAYGPDGTLWVAYNSYKLRDESRRIEPPSYKKQPENFKALYQPGFADQLFVKHYQRGQWSKPIAVTGPQEDLGRCAVSVEGDGTVWVIYSAHRQGNHDIYARSISKGVNPADDWRLGQEQRLTKDSGPNLNPVVGTTQAGELRVAYQHWYPEGGAGIRVIIGSSGQWKPGEEQKLQGTVWHPDVAAGPRGEWTLAHDTYAGGHYSVHAHAFAPGVLGAESPIAASSKFQARPSLAYDAKGRLWIAYEEGPELWGKDYGALVPDKGNPLYNARSVRVVCLENGKLFKPAADLPTSRHAPVVPPFDAQKTHFYEGVNARYAYPRIGIDGKGRVWLTYRQNFGSRYASHPGTYWLTYARRLDGDH